MRWLMLAAGISLEVVSSTSLKLSEGMRRPLPTVIAIVASIAGLVFFIFAVDRFSLSYAYAVWAGAGTIVVATIGMTYFDESHNWLKIASLIVIAIGLIGLNLAGAE